MSAGSDDGVLDPEDTESRPQREDPAVDTDVNEETAAMDGYQGDRREVGECHHCEDGIRYTSGDGNAVCDSCHAVSGRDSMDTSRCYRRPYPLCGRDDDREEYDVSQRKRMNGGYEEAYYSWNTGSEYAIDKGKSSRDEFLVPHYRDWSYTVEETST